MSIYEHKRYIKYAFDRVDGSLLSVGAHKGYCIILACVRSKAGQQESCWFAAADCMLFKDHCLRKRIYAQVRTHIITNVAQHPLGDVYKHSAQK